MANPNKSARDVIINDGAVTAGGAVKVASKGRVIPEGSGPGGATFTDKRDLKSGFPVPNSPYGKGDT